MSTYADTHQKLQLILTLMNELAMLIGTRATQSVVLDNGVKLVPGLGLNAEAEILLDRAKGLEQGIFTVVVIGEFKNGKSTLLNAMLQEEILPARVLPATAIITVLVYGEGQEVAVYQSGSLTPQLMSREEFKKEFSLTSKDQQSLDKQQVYDRFQHIEYAQFEVQNRLLANGVRLVDSPGLGEHFSRTRVAVSFMKRAQAVIFVLNATRILSLDEMEFIEDALGTGRLQHVFFAINFKNRLENQEDATELEEWLRNKLEPHFKNSDGQFDEAFYQQRVHFIDAKGALDARLRNTPDPQVLDDTGIPRFEVELETFLTGQDKFIAAIQSSLQTVSNIVKTALQGIAQERNLIAQPLHQLEKAHEEIERLLHQLELEKALLEKTIMQGGERIKHRVFTDLTSYLQNMFETWHEDAAQLKLQNVVSPQRLLQTFVNPVEKEQLQDDARREMHRYLGTKLNSWVMRAPDILKDDIQMMMNDIGGQVGRLDYELTQIQSDNPLPSAFIGNSTNVIQSRGLQVLQDLMQSILVDSSRVGTMVFGETNWSDFLGRAVSDGIVIGLMTGFWGGGAGLLSFLALTAIRARGNDAKMRQEIITKIGEQFKAGLLKELPHYQDEMYRTMDEHFQNIAKVLTHSLQTRIEQARESVNHLIRQRDDKTFSAQQEIERLDQIETRLKEALKLIYSLSYGKTPTDEEFTQLIG